ncbi:MAG: hypothetical protein D6688_06440 [Alphaproteobacteria bacterium]|nr:MAG: hypothetical protein D6688_06440 [Alphaproteobacteria bacterium]
MVAALRLLVFGFLFLSVIYLVARAYARSVHREALEKEWAEHPKGDRDQFVEEGMRAYERSLWPRLLLAIYVVPTVLILVAIIVVNFF